MDSKKCLNCDKEINLLGDFCSEDCSEKWQQKNQNCSKCGKEVNLLEGQYTISSNAEKSGILCFDCGHGDYCG